jgi:hypothetical protein
MAKKSIAAAQPLVLAPERTIFGIEFSRAGGYEVWGAIACAAGYTERIDRAMIYFSPLVDMAKKELARRHDRFSLSGSDVSIDDVAVHLCNELGIDYKSFEHNVKKLRIDGFIECVKTRIRELPRARSDVQRNVQYRRLRILWLRWVEGECERTDCEWDSHGACEEKYLSPDLSAIAEQLADDADRKQQLLSKIDVTPRGKSVKIANDALARIAVSSRRPSRAKRT